MSGTTTGGGPPDIIVISDPKGRCCAPITRDDAKTIHDALPEGEAASVVGMHKGKRKAPADCDLPAKLGTSPKQRGAHHKRGRSGDGMVSGGSALTSDSILGAREPSSDSLMVHDNSLICLTLGDDRDFDMDEPLGPVPLIMHGDSKPFGCQSKSRANPEQECANRPAKRRDNLHDVGMDKGQESSLQTEPRVLPAATDGQHVTRLNKGQESSLQPGDPMGRRAAAGAIPDPSTRPGQAEEGTLPARAILDPSTRPGKTKAGTLPASHRGNRLPTDAEAGGAAAGALVGHVAGQADTSIQPPQQVCSG